MFPHMFNTNAGGRRMSAVFVTEKPNRKQRRRVRAMPSPDAFAYANDDAQAMTGLGRTTLWKLRKEGRLKTITVNGKELIEGASLRQLMQPGEVA
jgi:hypothetical protein